MRYREIYQRSISDPEGFWRDEAAKLPWFTPPREILSQDTDGHDRWFSGGKTNLSWLALDRHIEAGRGDQVAIFYDSPVTGVQSQVTFTELRDQVSRFAGALRSLGVGRGDRVLVYMPMIPEVVVGMLACARIGAVHSVVFGGFAPQEVAIRIDDAEPKVILAATAGKEIQKIIPYMPVINDALKLANHHPDHVVILQREMMPYPLQNDHEHDWEELAAASEPAGWEEMEATDPLYILYTSGTTGKPKGIVRDTGGYAVALNSSLEMLYGAKPGEVFWAASDVGWVVGHSYIVYGPLLYGCSTVVFEGKPVRTPDAGTFWRMIEQYQVRTLFTAPTAIRAIVREDPEGAFLEQYDTSSLRYLFLAGERTDIPTLEWARDKLGKPVIDHWWQTESGWPMLCNPAGVDLLPIKPGSAGPAVFGYALDVLNASGQPCPDNEEGSVVVKTPLPPGNMPHLWRDEARFHSAYFAQFGGYFFTGDGGYRDEDGYFFITGRIDDIINVAGHRLSTSTMEEIVAEHPAVAECAVIAVEDNLKGHIPVGYVVLKAGQTITVAEIEKELIQQVRAKLGAVASFKRVIVVERLPKTRSGKILRKVMRAIGDGKEYRAPSTIEDKSVLDEIESASAGLRE